MGEAAVYIEREREREREREWGGGGREIGQTLLSLRHIHSLCIPSWPQAKPYKLAWLGLLWSEPNAFDHYPTDGERERVQILWTNQLLCLLLLLDIVSLLGN